MITKKFLLVVLIVVLFAVLLFGLLYLYLMYFYGSPSTGYSRNETEVVGKEDYSDLRNFGLTVDNFPVLDGATATQPLRSLIACRAFGLDCFWQENYTREMFVYFRTNNEFEGESILRKKLLNSKTHDAYVSLINKKVDLILTATKPSDDELRLANTNNVKLNVIPIGWDGFVFLVNKKNPIDNLTTAKLKQIYTKKVSSWNQLGGSSWQIMPFVRQENSGSQELMEKVFMKGEQISEFREEALYTGMMELIEGIDQHKEAVGYSLYYYKNAMIDRRNDNPDVKIIAVDRIMPSQESISSKKYPYIFNIYAVIREDLAKDSMAYKIAQWLTSEEGQNVVSEAGYVKIN